MSINKQYQALVTKILQKTKLPAVAEIHLPAAGDARDDEFGFIFLEDGSVGPFYTRLDDTLETLVSRRVSSAHKGTALTTLLDRLSSRDPADRALALGTFNAMSAHLMRRAGFSPALAHTSTGGGISSSREPVGMVGYFGPLVERLLAKGGEVLVIERRPERVMARPGVRVSTEPTALSNCSNILCTASTLINDSLDEILAAASNAESFSLIGPSGSGLPDVLFAHGVTSTGGIAFDDTPALKKALAQNESWGKIGAKCHLTPENYPGIDALLEKIE